MNTIRIGKIARLPEVVREELNRRIQDGVSGPRLCAWLNELPAVRAVLAAKFGDRPINEPNLTAWRRGGYRQWALDAEARGLSGGFGKRVVTPFAARLALLAGQCAVMEGRSAAIGTGKKDLALLGELCREVNRLRDAELLRVRRELASGPEKARSTSPFPGKPAALPPE